MALRRSCLSLQGSTPLSCCMSRVPDVCACWLHVKLLLQSRQQLTRSLPQRGRRQRLHSRCRCASSACCAMERTLTRCRHPSGSPAEQCTTALDKLKVVSPSTVRLFVVEGCRCV